MHVLHGSRSPGVLTGSFKCVVRRVGFDKSKGHEGEGPAGVKNGFSILSTNADSSRTFGEALRKTQKAGPLEHQIALAQEPHLCSLEDGCAE